MTSSPSQIFSTNPRRQKACPLSFFNQGTHLREEPVFVGTVLLAATAILYNIVHQRVFVVSFSYTHMWNTFFWAVISTLLLFPFAFKNKVLLPFNGPIDVLQHFWKAFLVFWGGRIFMVLLGSGPVHLIKCLAALPRQGLSQAPVPTATVLLMVKPENQIRNTASQILVIIGLVFFAAACSVSVEGKNYDALGYWLFGTQPFIIALLRKTWYEDSKH